MASPSRSFITRTPCVCLPWLGTSFTGRRITCPFLLITTNSPSSRSSPLSTEPLTTFPVLLVTFAVLMPEPPRFCTLYSFAGVVLPKPFSVMIKISAAGAASLRSTSAETTKSPFPSFIPRTPAAVRPICLMSDSLKRMDCPRELTSDTVSPVPTNRAEISASAPPSVIAISPLRRTSLKLATSTFFETPSRVTIIIAELLSFAPSQSSVRTARMEVTDSSGVSDKKFMIDFPFVARRPSGISYILMLYTFPLLVKKSKSLCSEVVSRVVTTSSSFVLRSTTPTPPRFCVRYSLGLVRLMYPPRVSTTTLSSSGTRSSGFSILTPPETPLEPRNQTLYFPQFVLYLFSLKPGKLREPHFKNSRRLQVGKMKLLDELGMRGRDIA